MVDIIVPSPGESISEVEIGSWLVEDKVYVTQGQEVALIESEKATLEVTAPDSGTIEILVAPGNRIGVGSVIARIDPSAPPERGKVASASSEKKVVEKTQAPATETVAPTPSGNKAGMENSSVKITPVARKMMEEHKLSVEDVIKGLKRLSKQEVQMVLETREVEPLETAQTELTAAVRGETRKRMSLLRSKLSERLVAVKLETAMLTTFNEIDMSAVIDLRNRYKGEFEKKHAVRLGFMSFFALAATRALQEFPQVNSMIDGEDIVEFNYIDIGVAVQTPKGLMVPAVRNTQGMTLAELEAGIAALAQKARENRISMDDLKGGTFSITNGGVFGSLLSTPILNPPQPAILGMHNIVDRPVALQGSVVIRPMMYVALSYDHRLIDGKDSVGFLLRIKEFIENPMKMLGKPGNPERNLLAL